MAIYNSKPHLLATQNLSIFFLLLVSKVKSDTFSFNFPSFDYEPDAKTILCVDDACISDGAIQLTVRDNSGQPLKHSVGRAVYFAPVQIYDKNNGKVADFTTEFSFDVDRKGSKYHGDGMSFFITSLDFDFPSNSSGGFLGIFSPETARNTSKNRIVAVEFDSYTNEEWDPNPNAGLSSTFPHIGIDINSIESVVTVPWSFGREEEGAKGKAKISYDSKTKELSVSLDYANNTPSGSSATHLSHIIDLRTVLPEWVGIGFSAATGEMAETHNILSWSFSSTL